MCCVCTHEGYKGRSLLVAQGKRKTLVELKLLLVSKNLVTKPDVPSGYFNPPSDTVLNKCHSPPTHIFTHCLVYCYQPRIRRRMEVLCKKLLDKPEDFAYRKIMNGVNKILVIN